jgi:hypothetical protein
MGMMEIADACPGAFLDVVLGLLFSLLEPQGDRAHLIRAAWIAALPEGAQPAIRTGRLTYCACSTGSCATKSFSTFHFDRTSS